MGETLIKFLDSWILICTLWSMLSSHTSVNEIFGFVCNLTNRWSEYKICRLEQGIQIHQTWSGITQVGNVTSSSATSTKWSFLYKARQTLIMSFYNVEIHIQIVCYIPQIKVSPSVMDIYDSRQLTNLGTEESIHSIYLVHLMYIIWGFQIWQFKLLDSVNMECPR